MASENETVADIIAEMRRGTKLQGYWSSSDLNEILIYNADRIEAAWKRERDRLMSEPRSWEECVERAMKVKENSDVPIDENENSGTVGNAAAMREALHALKEKFRDIDLARDSIEKEIYELADAALSNQPRNCDIYPTNEDAWRSYQLSHAKNADAYVEATVPDFIDWLFAPAAERKGAST